MSLRSWLFVSIVIGAAACLMVGAWLPGWPGEVPWTGIAAMLVLATLAQVLEVKAPGRQSYYPAMVFFFAGVVLLPLPWLLVLLTVPHVVEWLKVSMIDRIQRAWYIQPFNMATHILSGTLAQLLLAAFDPEARGMGSFQAIGGLVAGALGYVMLNHLLIGQALKLARGISWGESGILKLENLLTDLIMLLLGASLAVLWQVNAWLIVLALAPLILIYRALSVPKLKYDAQIDAKTGLINAAHFAQLYQGEFERANRFQRPLSLIVADLDLFRVLNNTYGHLGGDQVLASIGQLIRTAVRDYDIAGRFGGEEFTIVLPETGLADAVTVAERIRQSVECYPFVVNTSSEPITVTMSLGVATLEADTGDRMALLHTADVAVYQAKARGRNRVVSAADLTPEVLELEWPASVKAVVVGSADGRR